MFRAQLNPSSVNTKHFLLYIILVYITTFKNISEQNQKNKKKDKKQSTNSKVSSLTFFFCINSHTYVSVACGPWMRRTHKISNIQSIFINIDFKILGVSFNYQIIIRYFKYFYKKHFFVLKNILVHEMNCCIVLRGN